MEARELRIGNWVQGSELYKHKPLQFHRFNDRLDVCFFLNGSIHGIGEYLKDLTGIPLTSEWLEKFGFEVKGMFEEWLSKRIDDKDNYLYIHFEEDWSFQKSGFTLSNPHDSNDTQK